MECHLRINLFQEGSPGVIRVTYKSVGRAAEPSIPLAARIPNFTFGLVEFRGSSSDRHVISHPQSLSNELYGVFALTSVNQCNPRVSLHALLPSVGVS